LTHIDSISDKKMLLMIFLYGVKVEESGG